MSKAVSKPDKVSIMAAMQASVSDLRKFGITTIGLFGSFVRGEATQESDIDILVEFDPAQKTFNQFMEACFFLEELFQRDVELVTRESLSPYLKDAILKEIEYVPFTN